MYDTDMEWICETPIQDLGEYNSNHLFIKREDLLPFSFGGNKVRKAALFFREIDHGVYDCVVTYGSGSSNHCRVIANECRRRGLSCYIISPGEVPELTFNSRMMKLFGAEVTTVPVSEVHDMIEEKIGELKKADRKPYFIEGGGHGNIGTEAYVRCYQEIADQEKALNIHFDYIFFASGTGTTHAGLVCGQLLYGGERRIVGISIARKNPYGREVVLESIYSYLKEREVDIPDHLIGNATVFVDEFTGNGYGKENSGVLRTIREVMTVYGIPLDSTYTGKAFYGMRNYLKEELIKGKNILFIHTGGTPLFFNDLERI